MSRPNDNLLQKLSPGSNPKDGYPRKAWERLCVWLEELHEQSKSFAPFSLPEQGARSNLHRNDEFRLDCQGTFTVTGHPDIVWYNLQVQENTKRGKDESTTVMTTYVHKQGYKKSTDPNITCAVICRVMESQAKHAIPEMTIFVEEGQANRVNNVQRTPHGILEYNAPRPPPYKIWKP